MDKPAGAELPGCFQIEGEIWNVSINGMVRHSRKDTDSIPDESFREPGPGLAKISFHCGRSDRFRLRELAPTRAPQLGNLPVHHHIVELAQQEFPPDFDVIKLTAARLSFQAQPNAFALPWKDVSDGEGNVR